MHELNVYNGSAMVAIVAVILFVLVAPKGTATRAVNGVGNSIQWVVGKVAGLFGKKY